jgi:hypothetical protein
LYYLGTLSIDLGVLFGINKGKKKVKTKVNKAPQSDLTKEEQRTIDLIKNGKQEIADMHKFNSNYIKTIFKAANSNKCRDKIWLCMEVPKSSRCATFFHVFSLGMTLLSIIMFLAETTPDFNDYREGGRVCKQVVKHHCSNIYNKYNDAPDDIKRQAYLSNLGCWSSEFQKANLNITSFPNYRVQEYDEYYTNLDDKIEKENITKSEAYGGCFEVNGFKTSELHSKCNWPAPQLGFSCDPKLRWNYVHEGPNKKMTRPQNDVIEHGKKIYHTTWKNPFHHDWLKRENDYENRGVDSENKWKIAHSNDYGKSTDIEISICEREQCVSNDSTDWAPQFFLGELIFAFWFLIELILRLYSVRSKKKYFHSCGNIFEITAVIISLGEAIMIPILLGGMLYEVWGNPIGDPAVMRAFRLLVTIRFITMQRRFSGVKVIQMTVKKVAGKMKIPLFFFFVFSVIFASFFYIIESGDLFIDCNEGDYAPPNQLLIINNCIDNDSTMTRDDCVKEYNENWGVCRSCPQPSTTLSSSTNYNNQFIYNGTCSNFITLAGENGLRLAPPKIEDMLDAIWTMIVTMTTVGYGGKYQD